jgi:catechol 2,3-dioxygenase-like lactoylglutathione lyase family enzyme
MLDETHRLGRAGNAQDGCSAPWPLLAELLHQAKRVRVPRDALVEIADGECHVVEAGDGLHSVILADLRGSPALVMDSEEGRMLLDGVNHVAILTADTDRFVAFYQEVFGAEVIGSQDMGGEGTLTFVRIGDDAEINLFEVNGNTEAARQTPMFGRGRIGLQAASIEAFEEIRRRLMDRGAADDFVTDFGPGLSLFFRDPDGLEGEVCVPNPDARPGVFNPPGTPAARYVTT